MGIYNGLKNVEVKLTREEEVVARNLRKQYDKYNRQAWGIKDKYRDKDHNMDWDAFDANPHDVEAVNNLNSLAWKVDEAFRKFRDVIVFKHGIEDPGNSWIIGIDSPK